MVEIVGSQREALRASTALAAHKSNCRSFQNGPALAFVVLRAQAPSSLSTLRSTAFRTCVALSGCPERAVHVVPGPFADVVGIAEAGGISDSAAARMLTLNSTVVGRGRRYDIQAGAAGLSFQRAIQMVNKPTLVRQHALDGLRKSTHMLPLKYARLRLRGRFDDRLPMAQVALERHGRAGRYLPALALRYVSNLRRNRHDRRLAYQNRAFVYMSGR